MRDYSLCMHTLDELHQEDPTDTALLQYMGRVNIQVGDCHAAWACFSKAEQLLGKDKADQCVHVHTNRGILSLALSKYEVCGLVYMLTYAIYM